MYIGFRCLPFASIRFSSGVGHHCRFVPLIFYSVQLFLFCFCILYTTFRRPESAFTGSFQFVLFWICQGPFTVRQVPDKNILKKNLMFLI